MRLPWWLLVLTTSLLLVWTGWLVLQSNHLEQAAREDTKANHVLAVRHALDHLKRRPWSRQAAKIAARGLSKLDHADLAEPYYARCGTLDREDQHIRAYGLVRANEREKAVDAYRALLQDYPSDALALRRLAAVHLSRVEYDAARELAVRMTRIPGAEVVGYTLLGSTEHSDREPLAAVNAWEQVFERDPGLEQMPLPRQEFWTEVIADYLDVGRTDRVVEFIERASRDVGKVPDFLALAGRAYQQAGRLDEAESAWKSVLELDPTRPVIWASLGRLALQRNQLDQAKRFLDRAIEIDPKAPDPHYSLAQLYRLQGRGELEKAARETFLKLGGGRVAPGAGMGADPAQP